MHRAIRHRGAFAAFVASTAALYVAYGRPSSSLRRPALAEPVRPAAAAAAAARPWQAAPNPAEYVEEPLTKTRFPKGILREAAGRDNTTTLFRLGAVSVRVMMNLTWLERARAYAFAVYLSPSAVRAVSTNPPADALAELNPVPKPGAEAFIPSASWQGSQPGYVFTNRELGLGYYLDGRSPLQQPLPECMVRLVMLRDVDGDHLARGFDKTLEAREASVGAAIPSRHEFVRLLAMLDKVPKDTVLDLFRDEFGRVSVVVNAAVLHVFTDPLLGWALIDAFVGPKGHLGAKGKAELVARATDIFQTRPLAEFTEHVASSSS